MGSGGVFGGRKGLGGSTFLGSSANPVGAALSQTGLSEEDQRTAGLILDPGGALTEETFFKAPEELEPPAVPDLNLPTESDIQEKARKARENELIRRAGTRGGAGTIRTGSRGVAGRALTTSKVLGG